MGAYDDLKGDELREALKLRELPHAGTNAEMIERLEADDAAKAAAAAGGSSDSGSGDGGDGSDNGAGHDEPTPDAAVDGRRLTKTVTFPDGRTLGPQDELPTEYAEQLDAAAKEAGLDVHPAFTAD